MRWIDKAPKVADFVADAEVSLAETPPRLGSKHLYDARGSELFDAITRVDEYYLTRVETSIFERVMPELADTVGEGVRVVELGSGMGDKTLRLLAGLNAPSEVVLIDISKEALVRGAEGLEARFAGLAVTAICADYDQPVALDPHHGRTIVFFPGSTLGNFTREAAVHFLARQAQRVGPGGGLVLGTDLVKDPATLEAAYDDAAGVTSDFNRHLLTRLAQGGATVEPEHFAHEARWVAEHERIEMHLVATRDTQLRVGATALSLAAGQSILTEHCHKYTRASLQSLLSEAGWALETVWTDEAEQFAVSWSVAR